MRVLFATGEAAPEIIRALRTAFIEARQRATVAQHGGKQLHKARLALKRLRYMAEPLCGIVPGVTAAWINQLHRCQRTMGDIHDLELLTDRMTKHMAQRPRLRRLQTVGLAKKKRLLRAYRSRLPAPPEQLRRILAG